MSKKFLILISLIVTTSAVSACGERSQKVEPLKRGDKNLSCSDIMLEINEADQYKNMAYEKRQLGIKSIVMPLGYIDTYMSADEAIAAADSRVQYLNKIYEIKNCDAQSSAQQTSQARPQTSDAQIQNTIQRSMMTQQPQRQAPPVYYQQQAQPQQNYGYGYPAQPQRY